MFLGKRKRLTDTSGHDEDGSSIKISPVAAMASTPSERSSFSMDPTVRWMKTQRFSIPTTPTIANDSTEEEKSINLKTFSFCVKVLELLGSVLAETLFIWACTLIANNISTFIFPHVVYNTYVIVNSVIVISYLANMKMQEMLIRMFGMLAAILFLTASAVTLYQCFVFWEPFKLAIEAESDLESEYGEREFIASRRSALVAQGIIAALCGAAHVTDVYMSIHQTIKNM